PARPECASACRSESRVRSHQRAGECSPWNKPARRRQAGTVEPRLLQGKVPTLDRPVQSSCWYKFCRVQSTVKRFTRARESRPIFRVWGFGFRVSGLAFRFPGSGFRVSGFGYRVSGFGLQVSGFGVSGFGFRATGVQRFPRFQNQLWKTRRRQSYELIG
ncbi:hypothetical protein T484DRAFT_3630762, partial [Baffinella frigidus]